MILGIIANSGVLDTNGIFNNEATMQGVNRTAAAINKASNELKQQRLVAKDDREIEIAIHSIDKLSKNYGDLLKGLLNESAVHYHNQDRLDSTLSIRTIRHIGIFKQHFADYDIIVDIADEEGCIEVAKSFNDILRLPKSYFEKCYGDQEKAGHYKKCSFPFIEIPTPMTMPKFIIHDIERPSP